MKTNQDGNTGTIRNGRSRTTGKRYVKAKKLRIEADGVHSRLLSAQQISELAHVSLSHAYKIIADPDKYLTAQTYELLKIKALGQIPGWPAGWKFDALAGEVLSPEGLKFCCDDLENFAIAQQLLRRWETLAEDQKQEIADQLKHIEALERRLKLPRELRLYVNDELQPRRTLEHPEYKVSQKPNLKVVGE